MNERIEVAITSTNVSDKEFLDIEEGVSSRALAGFNILPKHLNHLSLNTKNYVFLDPGRHDPTFLDYTIKFYQSKYANRVAGFNIILDTNKLHSTEDIIDIIKNVSNHRPRIWIKYCDIDTASYISDILDILRAHGITNVIVWPKKNSKQTMVDIENIWKDQDFHIGLYLNPKLYTEHNLRRFKELKIHPIILPGQTIISSI